MPNAESPSATAGSGEGELPRVVLTSAGGRAEVYLHGAHVARWVDARGHDVLYLSPRSRFDAQSAIRGGIPVIFPQFADLGPLPKHGFARTAEWSLADASADGEGARAVLRLADSPATRAVWDHAFAAELVVELTAELTVTLRVQNTGDRPFAFTAALHKYFSVDDVRRIAIRGLAGVGYHDKVADRNAVQTDDELRLTGETDRVFYGAPNVLRMGDAGREIVVRKRGFPDAVVWNPWAEAAAKLADMGGDQWTRFVCVEAAHVGTPVRLGLGERWEAGETIRAG
jgi:glucose-6-phosphate 1-epimerase